MSPQPDHRPKVTPVELAKRMRVDVRKVNDWIESGELPAINVAPPGAKQRQYRIDERDIEVFEAARNAAVQPIAKRRATQRRGRRFKRKLELLV